MMLCPFIQKHSQFVVTNDAPIAIANHNKLIQKVERELLREIILDGETRPTQQTTLPSVTGSARSSLCLCAVSCALRHVQVPSQGENP
jgi:hypothetical protein